MDKDSAKNKMMMTLIIDQRPLYTQPGKEEKLGPYFLASENNRFKSKSFLGFGYFFFSRAKPKSFCFSKACESSRKEFGYPCEIELWGDSTYISILVEELKGGCCRQREIRHIVENVARREECTRERTCLKDGLGTDFCALLDELSSPYVYAACIIRISRSTFGSDWAILPFNNVVSYCGIVFRSKNCLRGLLSVGMTWRRAKDGGARIRNCSSRSGRGEKGGVQGDRKTCPSSDHGAGCVGFPENGVSYPQFGPEYKSLPPPGGGEDFHREGMIGLVSVIRMTDQVRRGRKLIYGLQLPHPASLRRQDSEGYSPTICRLPLNSACGRYCARALFTIEVHLGSDHSQISLSEFLRLWRRIMAKQSRRGAASSTVQ
ncbi:hypothetical protein NPIL_553511 [Nephila pilipes]|uniref:Uncharacterized protein n=1 Tax=Nephila pilipes TaxID=299642 RepID=A0A8X6M8A1_NEPPI|nr:hypothetical protein NPIL_553511 [Nephila pilipes]